MIDKDSVQTKQTLIACYCHYKSFSAVLLEKIISDNVSANVDKRWTVLKLVKGIPSFDLIEKELLTLKTDSKHIGSILINKEFLFLDKVLNHKLSFRKVEIDSISENFGSFNADIFTLIALVNDKKLAFKKECSELIEEIKFFNPANHSNDLNALLLGIKTIPINSFNYLLIS